MKRNVVSSVFHVLSLFYFKFYFYFILLCNTVLVLPYIDMNPPRVYTAIVRSDLWLPEEGVVGIGSIKILDGMIQMNSKNL